MYRDPYILRPLADYHEDYGTVLWWHLPIQEPPHVGSGPGLSERNADGLPTDCACLLKQGYLTHWSVIPQPSLDGSLPPVAAKT